MSTELFKLFTKEISVMKDDNWYATSKSYYSFLHNADSELITELFMLLYVEGLYRNIIGVD